MLRRIQYRAIPGAPWTAAMLLAVALTAVCCQTACALIMGGEGNSPIRDPGWPAGADAIFNTPARIAYWVGPPFGGGQWHAECRGDAQAFRAVLADFAKLDVKTKRLVVHDGVGCSFWLNPNREPARRAAAAVDWMFMVWVPRGWENVRKLPAELNPIDPKDADKGPPAQIDVYTGGNLRWSDMKVPEGIDLIDERLEMHGFKPSDGIVLEGKVIDLATRRPVAARIQLQHIESGPKGKRTYTVVREATADRQGGWVLKKRAGRWTSLGRGGGRLCASSRLCPV